MNKDKNFLDALDDWGTILTDTYEQHTDEVIYNSEGLLITKTDKNNDDSEIISTVNFTNEDGTTFVDIYMERIIWPSFDYYDFTYNNPNYKEGEYYFDYIIYSLETTSILNSDNTLNDVTVGFSVLTNVYLKSVDHSQPVKKLHENRIAYKSYTFSYNKPAYLNPIMLTSLMDECAIDLSKEYKMFENVFRETAQIANSEIKNFLNKNNTEFDNVSI